ncbi:Ribosomal-protein-alanine acetyltransferase [Planktothrix sp. PCC 11201]|uniref:ribosomal protein S18-alanine N-acetyltransferase n=1 Tax=Planktothrix sp. PCC 11201 TaxID=1729650 RepID=UPI000912DF4F|nr:ribosomal protein S18-alanine N-acetyltransferase [Planktothrix sp. PCC 11201]SKB15952.1 Ribosomal-protein-alanine acetyltransferase [Planktothrix sp. PCC 11201]
MGKQYLKLQLLTVDQLSAVVELDQRCLGGLWTKDGYQREIESPNSDLIIWKREGKTGDQEPKKEEFQLPQIELTDVESSSDQLIGIGCLWAILEEAHITILAIDPEYQGKGLGQALLFQLLVSAWKRKLERATLEVKVSNQPAINLYKKFGFKEAGCRKGYYQDTGEDALILWRGDLHHPHFPNTLHHWYQEICLKLN